MDRDRILAALGQGKNVLGSRKECFLVETAIRDRVRTGIELTPEQEDYIRLVEDA